jgi:broad specificity phosphatase PhoE
MDKKTIYFVRHGESEDNTQPVIQSDASPLSEKGKKQTQVLAQRFEHLPVDKIFASPYERTRQTAEAVQKIIGKEIDFDDTFREIRHSPSSLHGKLLEDEAVKTVRDEIWSKRFDPEFRYADEENFSDRMLRGRSALEKLIVCPEQHILVISHGGIIRTIMAHMMFGNELTPQEYYRVLSFMHMGNTGITVCRYHIEESRWQLINWNDIAHLGE